MPEPLEQPAPGTPAETNPTPPTEPKKTYTQEELDEIVRKAVNTAVTTEKDKLYDTIEKLKSDVAKGNEFFQKMEDEKKKALTEAENQKREKLTETQRLSLQLEELQKQISQMNENHKRELDDLKIKAQQKALDDHKEKLLLKYKDEIVSGLVMGNTIEELDASVERARKEYKDILAKAEQKKQTDSQAQAQQSAPKPLETAEPTSPQPAITSVSPRAAKTLDELRSVEEDVVGSFVKSLK